ncbi:hypothetical protein [Deinococcus radiotolerans]|uniref:DUF3325 domain-containing protein n=1 Tax=Deinococcus radiotolerans TaxID=1309407 RepID=A0ABQ2FNU3_9DEIO|nr:hypothetical protein [Deinococcus radiotolerans]GGL12168.1 hypothetical protein GCM10010844_33550 [Deinococcus radiotolerans]
MNDLQLFLSVLTALGLISSVWMLRSAARRLHYRDRSAYWVRVAPLLLCGVVALVLLALALSHAGTTLLWSGAALAAVTAAGSYWVELNPQRVLARRSRS